jgi:hypothetical protein
MFTYGLQYYVLPITGRPSYWKHFLYCIQRCFTIEADKFQASKQLADKHAKAFIQQQVVLIQRVLIRKPLDFVIKPVSDPLGEIELVILNLALKTLLFHFGPDPLLPTVIPPHLIHPLFMGLETYDLIRLHC